MITIILIVKKHNSLNVAYLQGGGDFMTIFAKNDYLVKVVDIDQFFCIRANVDLRKYEI